MLMSIGETICDMHYGLPTRSMYPENAPLETRKHVRVEMTESRKVLEALLAGLQLRDTTRTNKMAVVVGYGSEGWMTAAYSYDDRIFGMFEFRYRSTGE